MKFFCMAAVCGAFAAAAPAAAAAAHDVGPRYLSTCHPPASETVRAYRAARVFWIPRKRRSYGCLYRRARAYSLGPGRYYRFDLAGPYLAYTDAPGGGPTVKIFDLRTGHARFFTHHYGWSTLALRATTRGSLAWIWRRDSNPATYEVRKAERAPDGGDNVITVLDSGRDIDPTSLRLAGATVRWVSAGIEHSAPIQ